MTQTLRPNGNDRFDLKLFQRSFSQMIRDLRKKTGAEIRYLIVPERHKMAHGIYMACWRESHRICWNVLPLTSICPITFAGKC